MNRKLERLCAPLLLVACFLLMSALPASARDPRTGPVVIHDSYHDVSPPLWQVAIPAVPHVGPNRTIGLLRGNVTPQVTVERRDPVGDNPGGRTPVKTIDLLNFDGQNADGVAPPDTNGAVGATQFVQWVNLEYNVYDKTTGAKIIGPIQGNSFWSGFGGSCASANDGDPIIQYDKAAGVWVAFQNVFSTPYTACLAVSTTSDATGTYNRYSFTLPESNSDFPDYPKWGVWPDGYYMSYADFQGGFNLQFFEACAADRANILLGNPATMQCFDAPNNDTQGLPGDLDGLTAPPAGAPNHFIHLNTTGTSSLEQLDFHVDFTNPTNSTFTDKGAISVAAFTLICSSGTNRNCIKQPSGGEGLDSLGDRLMYRNSYRNFGTYESILDTHTVKPTSGTGVGSVRWYELRSTPPGGPFTVFQQGTINEATNSLWMASLAQDKLGDIAIGMSASGTALDPSIVYTGRVPTDTKGRVEGFKIVVKGTGVQKSTSNRWGDYSSMSVDPTDDCTFWFTEEYIKTTGSFNWSTRINSFKFNGCT
ncbi:MAG TPA: hypothetical protein VGW33_15475 [Terriglobia bacterium]|nr:hypothetical protein [Terriglobia bacterium]